MQQIGHAVWLDGLVLLVAGLMILDLTWNCGRGHWIIDGMELATMDPKFME